MIDLGDPYFCEKCTDALNTSLALMNAGGGNIVYHSKEFPCPLENQEAVEDGHRRNRN